MQPALMDMSIRITSILLNKGTEYNHNSGSRSYPLLPLFNAIDHYQLTMSLNLLELMNLPMKPF